MMRNLPSHVFLSVLRAIRIPLTRERKIIIIVTSFALLPAGLSESEEYSFFANIATGEHRLPGVFGKLRIMSQDALSFPQLDIRLDVSNKGNDFLLKMYHYRTIN